MVAAPWAAPAGAPGPEYGGTLVLGTPFELAELNPFTTQGTLSANLCDIVFDSLVNLDDNGGPTPRLAKAWEVSSDGTLWRFFLAGNATFHDGVPVTADDVVFTFRVLAGLSSGAYAPALANVEYVERDGDEVVIRLKLRDRIFPYLLRRVRIAPRHAYGEDGRPLAGFSLPLGSGPFVLRELSQTHAVLAANPSYYRGAPYLDGIRVEVIADTRESLARLINGKLDLLIFHDSHQWPAIADIPSLGLFPYRNATLIGIFFNMDREIFKDTRVRRALNLAVRKPPATDGLRPAASVVSPDSPLADTGFKPYPYDPRQALTLLNEAGWERGPDGLLRRDGRPLEITITLPSGSEFLEREIKRVVQDLEGIGVTLKLLFLPFPELAHRVFLEHSFEATLFTYSQTYPLDFDRLLWASRGLGGYNFTGYNNAEADRSLEDARYATTEEESVADYRRFQRVIHDDPPLIYLFWRRQKLLYNRRVHGLEESPSRFYPEMHRVWIGAE